MYERFRSEFLTAANDAGIRAGDLVKALQVMDQVATKYWLAYRHKKAGNADGDPGCIWCAPGHEVCGTCARFFGGQAGGCATEPNDEKCAVYVPADHCMKCGRKLRPTAED